MQSVAIYKIKNEYKIHSQSLTNDGFWIATEPYFNIPDTIDQKDLSHFIFQALAKSEQNVKTPIDWPQYSRNYVKNLNLKSLRELQEKAKLCSLEEDTYFYIITPNKRGGFKEGFIPIHELEIKIPKEQPRVEIVTHIVNLLEA